MISNEPRHPSRSKFIALSVSVDCFGGQLLRGYEFLILASQATTVVELNVLLCVAWPGLVICVILVIQNDLLDALLGLLAFSAPPPTCDDILVCNIRRAHFSFAPNLVMVFLAHCEVVCIERSSFVLCGGLGRFLASGPILTALART